MLITLQFHPLLVPMTGVKSHTFDVSSIEGIKQALPVLFPKMRKYIRQVLSGTLKENLCLITESGKTVTKKDYFVNKLSSETYHLVPIIGGAGGKTGAFIGIAIGIALIATGVGAPAGATFLGGAISTSTLITAGIGLALSGVTQLLAKPPSTPESRSNASAEVRRNNDIFDSIENTTDPNNSVALIYGMTRVGGQMLSGHIETITHGKNDNIHVSDLFYKNINEFTKTN